MMTGRSAVSRKSFKISSSPTATLDPTPRAAAERQRERDDQRRHDQRRPDASRAPNTRRATAVQVTSTAHPSTS